jgi:SAM-dependent methyltransferase
VSAPFEWITWLRCPHCAGECSGPPIVCEACGFEYPSYGGIPVVRARPHDLVDQWRFRLAEFETSNDGTRRRIVADLATKNIAAPTRARLERVARGLALHGERITGLLNDAGIVGTRRRAPEPDGVPTENSITAYIHQVHRDWGWDDDGSTENTDAFAEVAAVLGDAPRLGKMLVIGAGGCRLASDVHRFADTTIAIDINAAPMLVARKVLRGEPIALVELPLAPPDLARVYIDRDLKAPALPGPGFVQIFADAFALPFQAGTFDTVLTPWFIDQVPKDIATFLPEIRRMLRPGGRWINHGPLIYHPARTEIAARYPADELYGLVADAGFDMQASRATRLPYLQSPACTRGRAEVVLTFVATKAEREVATSPTDEPPEWTRNPGLPVPRLEGLDRYQPPHPLFATVVKLIDGERTAQQIAEILIRDYKLPPGAATPGVLTCLQEIWRATRELP